MCRFVPDLDDIVTFEDMVAEETFSEETKVSAKWVTDIFIAYCTPWHTDYLILLLEICPKISLKGMNILRYVL